MPRRSAGLLLHRLGPDGGRQVLLVHPGGPFWAKKDDGAWSIPKGEIGEGEIGEGESESEDGGGDAGAADADAGGPKPERDPLAHAEREFREELGRAAPPGERVPLGEVVQAGGKHVVAWAVESDLDLDGVDVAAVSNRFELQWPPRSGRVQSFPEVDRAEWFDVTEARQKLVPAQVAFLDRLLDRRP